jgi:hypothetical protein
MRSAGASRPFLSKIYRRRCPPSEKEVRKMEAKQIVSLCPACDACPAVEVYEETVLIGEANNEVVLAKAEWNALVDAVLQKKLTKL